MKKATERTLTKSTVAVLAPTVGARISQTIIVSFFGVSGLIGVWSFAAIIGGLITAGPTTMFKGFITAVLGG